MVVVPEPAVKGRGAFSACAVDRCVGPAVEHCADEAFCLLVCLGPVGPRAQVADPELAAGECVHDAAVAAAVVGEYALDDDAVAAVESERAAQKTGCRCRSFVGEHLRVGEAAVVVDSDVDVLPALLALVATVAAVAGNAMAGAI